MNFFDARSSTKRHGANAPNALGTFSQNMGSNLTANLAKALDYRSINCYAVRIRV